MKDWPGRSAFVTDLPKAELHVHQVGSASARIVGELARSAVRASFADEPTKTRILAEIDAHQAGTAPGLVDPGQV